MIDLTVQQLIDQLQSIEDKSLPVYVIDVGARPYWDVAQLQLGAVEVKTPEPCVLIYSS